MPELLKMACLSLPGRKHSDKGQPNEDACFCQNNNGVHVVCLSDGAGGSRYTSASMGSQSVTRTVTDLLTKHFDAFYHDVRENVIRSILITAIQSELAILANEHQIDGIEKLSATMMFCAVKDTRMICGHIGDGLIARVSGSGIVPITLPQNGENTGSTFFVTFPDAQDYLRVIKTTTDDVHAIVLMTDGLTEMVYDPSAYLIRPVVASLAELADLPDDERDEQIKDTIQQFVINPSKISDDATIGILYFTGTEVPDASKFPSEKPMPNADYKDVMRNVQLELLPRVKLARSIVHRNGNATTCEEHKDSSDRAVEMSGEQATKSDQRKPGQHKPFKRKYLWLMAGLMAVALIIALYVYFVK
ncbi:MAG: protein phosphatase 2C domain-containing protein [Clostridiales bacterium]|nr:protein phosphatase 2C domain-containing protein [Clostridiales bacterium]